MSYIASYKLAQIQLLTISILTCLPIVHTQQRSCDQYQPDRWPLCGAHHNLAYLRLQAAVVGVSLDANLLDAQAGVQLFDAVVYAVEADVVEADVVVAAAVVVAAVAVVLAEQLVAVVPGSIAAASTAAEPVF